MIHFHFDIVFVVHYWVKGTVKLKVKFILEQTMVDQKGIRALPSAVLLHFFFDAKDHVIPQHPVL